MQESTWQIFAYENHDLAVQPDKIVVQSWQSKAL